MLTFFKTMLGACALTLSMAGSAAAEKTGQSSDALAQAAAPSAAQPSVQLIRNATLKISYGDTVFLVDPMLAPQGEYPGFPGTYRSDLRNPLTPLPMPLADILSGVDAVLLTHTHSDHWDEAAQKALPKNLPIFVQHKDDAKLVRSQGFSDVRILENHAEFGGVNLQRTECRHGSPAMFADEEMAKMAGSVMGLVFKAPDAKSIYVAADTVWFEGVDKAIASHTPDVIILNTGRAALALEKFKDDPYIIMGKEDTLRAARAAPQAAIVAVHMDAINHMTVNRRDLSEYVNAQGIRHRVLIPFDGETLRFGSTNAARE